MSQASFENLKTIIGDEEAKELQRNFTLIDQNHNQKVDSEEIMQALHRLGRFEITKAHVDKFLSKAEYTSNGILDFDAFGKVQKLCLSHSSDLPEIPRETEKCNAPETCHDLIPTVVKSAPEEERKVEAPAPPKLNVSEEGALFVDYVNFLLAQEKGLEGKVPINPSNNLFDALSDGQLLCKLLWKVNPRALDERAINVGPSLTEAQSRENIKLAISAASALGCYVHGIESQDIFKVTDTTKVDSLLWQLIRIAVFSPINLRNFPGLLQLLHDKEEFSEFLRLSEEETIIRWATYHLEKAGVPSNIGTAGPELADGEKFARLINRVHPNLLGADAIAQPAPARIKAVVDAVNRLGVKRAFTEANLSKGNPRINLLLLAEVLKLGVGIEADETEKKEAAKIVEDSSNVTAESREERAFTKFLNTISEDIWVQNLFEDLKDGVVLLKIVEDINPGAINWKKSVPQPNNKFHKIQNCNLAVEVGKQMGLHLESVAGSDLVEGNKKLINAFVWQLIHFQILKNLGNIHEDQVLEWAQKRVTREPKITSLRDPSIRSCTFLFNLLETINPRVINWSLVTPGVSPDQVEQNAKYLISVAMKMGISTFVQWEDIKEVNPRMLLTFLADIYKFANSQAKQ